MSACISSFNLCLQVIAADLLKAFEGACKPSLEAPAFLGRRSGLSRGGMREEGPGGIKRPSRGGELVARPHR